MTRHTLIGEIKQQMRFLTFNFKRRVAIVPKRTAVVELPQLSLEDIALLNYNAMRAAAFGRERQAIDQQSGG